MGVHISVQTIDGKDHPTWDFGRYAGDRDIAALFHDEIVHTIGDPLDGYRLSKPREISVLRAAAPNWPNPERLIELADILEKQPEYWVHFGF